MDERSSKSKENEVLGHWVKE